MIVIEFVFGPKSSNAPNAQHQDKLHKFAVQASQYSTGVMLRHDVTSLWWQET